MNGTMRITMILALVAAGCNGGGESTTAMTSGDDATTTDATTTDAPTTTGGDTTGECPEVMLEGEWLSEGENVAPLLVNVLMTESVSATFEETTFEVVSTDQSGTMGTQTGTYQITLCPGSDTKYSILLEQTMPQAITVEGIFELDGCMDPAMMRYEVIQTQPDLGEPAPTCAEDFGAGSFGADNIQIFVRQ